VFHVSLLHPYHKNNIDNRSPPPPSPITVNDENEFEVERILDSRIRYRKLQYLIEWKGYGPNERTWEPLSNLTHCSSLLRRFHRLNPSKTRPCQEEGIM